MVQSSFFFISENKHWWTFPASHKKHLPKGHRFHKIFNRNYLKLSYSTTRNMASHISAHNKKVLNPKMEAPMETCVHRAYYTLSKIDVMKAHLCTKQMSVQLIPPKHTMDWPEQHLRRGMGAILTK